MDIKNNNDVGEPDCVIYVVIDPATMETWRFIVNKVTEQIIDSNFKEFIYQNWNDERFNPEYEVHKIT